MDVKYSYYNTSKGYRVVGGTAAHFLKADGSVDNTLYIPANTEINMADKNLNFTSGSLSKFENGSRVFNKVYQRFSNANQVGILSFKFPQASTSATMFDVTLKIYGWQNRILGKIRIGFYKITGVAVNASHKAIIECSDNFPTNIINVGIDAAGMVCINIGEATTVWNTYLNVEVERVVSFHSGGNFDWSKGWSQTIETDVSSYISIATVATEVVASRSWTDANNIGSIPKAPTALGGNSLNTITTPGFYAQNSNSNATDANSYPTNLAGFLVVNRTTGGGLVQAYTDYSNAVTWKRIFNGTSWGNWRKLWSELDFTSANINNWNNSASQASLLNYYTKNEALNLFVGKNGVETIADTKTFTHSPVIPDGTLGTHAINKNQIALSTIPENEGGQQLNISGNNSVNLTNFYVTSRDGSRNPDDIAPNSTPRRVRFDFANSTSAGLEGSGNYAGIMTFAPWDGTTASTGDSSYQLAFANQSGSNGDGLPMLKIRKGIDGKWTTSWYKFWTQADFTTTNIQQWNSAYSGILSDVLNFNNNEGDYTRYYKLDGSSFDRLRIGTGIVDTRVMGNGLGSDGSSTFMPNSGNKALNHKLLPLFHEVSGRGYQSSLILKGWTDTYRAWRITGPADVGNKEEDFFLSQTNSDTGKWIKERKIWTDKHFTQANINSWNSYASSNGIQLNVEFTTNTGAGLIIADDSGGYSGMIDKTDKRFVSGKQNEYYKYGSLNGYFDGLNFNFGTSLFGMGREANKTDKLTVAGSIKASKNFKSEDEKPDTIFIPNGETASLRDEIVNDESDYAIRLDPHEYEIDSFSILQVDDRNRLIHVIGSQVEMGVNFNKIYPKQQIVIYNFDQKGNSMEVQINGSSRYKIEPHCFLRLYVTKSLRVIAERQQPCEFVW